jgi:hypothetical protein
MALVVAVTILLASWPGSVAAQSAATAAAEDLLQSIVARITVRSPLGAGLCHGFVATVRDDVAYIVTAKHCVEDLSPATIQRKWRDPDLAITIAYANGGTGIYRQVFWQIAQDDLVIAASFDRRPASYTGQCLNCISYRTVATTSRPIPVLSMLSSARGMPVLSTGMVLVTDTGEWIVLLPTAPGTSGAPVIDLQGNLVGIVSSATVVRGTQAGVMVKLVPGAFTSDLVRYAIAQEKGASSTLPPPPPTPTPAVPPKVPTPSAPDTAPSGIEGAVFWVSPDHTEFTIVINQSVWSISLVSDRPCPRIHDYDRVILRIKNGSATISTSTATCSMRLVSVNAPVDPGSPP